MGTRQAGMKKQEHERRTCVSRACVCVCKHACATAGVRQLGKRGKKQPAGGGRPVMRR